MSIEKKVYMELNSPEITDVDVLVDAALAQTDIATISEQVVQQPQPAQTVNPALLAGLPTDTPTIYAGTSFLNANGQVMHDDAAIENIGMKKVGSFDKVFLDGKKSINQMQSLDTFNQDWWKKSAETVGHTMKDYGTFLVDLKAAGMVETVKRPLGVLAKKTHEQSDAFDPITSMSIAVKGDRDRVRFKSVLDAMPVVTTGFSLGTREVEAAKNNDFSLIDANTNASIEAVVKTMEKNAVNNTFSVGGEVRALDSLCTFAGAAKGSLAAVWDDTTPVISMYNDVRKMLNMMNTNFQYGNGTKFSLYLNPDKRALLGKFVQNQDNNNKLNIGITLKQMLNSADDNITIKFHPDVPTSKIALIAMNKRGTVLQHCIVPSVIEWYNMTEDMKHHVMVVGMLPVHYKTDYNGSSNIVILEN